MVGAELFVSVNVSVYRCLPVVTSSQCFSANSWAR
ncbi:MAG: hypothetical protein RIS44_2963 [Pseudomonadota bacterium]|jgi:hypothetical protein